MPSVFDRFRQADASITRRHGGLGMGLSIAKHLVEQHGGTVRPTSAGPGKGATFTVSLPTAARSSAGPAVEPTPRRREEPVEPPTLLDLPSLDGLEVLFVDDEADSREMVQRLLQEQGAVVRATGSAAAALAAFEEAAAHVLVSDIGMPVTDGYELFRRIRALDPEVGGRMPALALTAYARSTDRQAVLVAGYQLHLAKPIEAAALVTQVARLAGRT